MKICFVPIDNRPVCYDLAKDIVSIDSSIELFLPPLEYLGGLNQNANIDKILEWLKKCPKSDAIVLALDTVAYGGLIPSRRSEESFILIKERIENLKQILLEKEAKIFAFSSIMRISNNNYNEEEKVYWKDYGKKIFQYSYSGGKDRSDIPQAILDDYLATRKRNFEINKIYFEWQKEGLFDTLIFSKDDCAEFGFNVDEARELERLGAKTKTGADEIPLSLLSRAVNKEIKVYVGYTEPEYKNLVSNYEDVSVEESVRGQLELAGFKLVQTEQESDVVLLVNNFVQKQGELVMGWTTKMYNKDLKLPQKPFAVADIRFANGADNNFVDCLFTKFDKHNFLGYAGWNTTANTLGSLLAQVKLAFKPASFNKKAFEKNLIIRFLDDWAYQANVRGQIKAQSNISKQMEFFEKRIFEVLKISDKYNITYDYPWNRKFEIRIKLS